MTNTSVTVDEAGIAEVINESFAEPSPAVTAARTES